MKVLVVSDNYPSKENPNEYVFVKKLVEGLEQIDNTVLVISPKVFYKKRGVRNSERNIYRPPYFSFFVSRKIISRIMMPLRNYSLRIAINNSLKKSEFVPDIIYVHFMSMAIPMIKLSKKMGVPIVVGLGESSYNRLNLNYSIETIMSHVKSIDSFISVSQQNKSYFIDNYYCISSRIHVLPNGVQDDFFNFNMNKSDAREILGYNKDIFIVSFVGPFVYRKGPDRVLKAIENLEGVYGIFLGSGSLAIEGEKVLFSGKVKNHDVKKYLAASDVFVLPTLNEGSSNAIAEAMAIGLPIISSNIPEIKEQVSLKSSILVNPTSIEDITSAIFKVLDNPMLRRQFAVNSKKESEKYKLSSRVMSINRIMTELVKRL